MSLQKNQKKKPVSRIRYSDKNMRVQEYTVSQDPVMDAVYSCTWILWRIRCTLVLALQYKRTNTDSTSPSEEQIWRMLSDVCRRMLWSMLSDVCRRRQCTLVLALLVQVYDVSDRRTRGNNSANRERPDCSSERKGTHEAVRSASVVLGDGRTNA